MGIFTIMAFRYKYAELKSSDENLTTVPAKTLTKVEKDMPEVKIPETKTHDTKAPETQMPDTEEKK